MARKVRSRGKVRKSVRPGTRDTVTPIGQQVFEFVIEHLIRVKISLKG